MQPRSSRISEELLMFTAIRMPRTRVSAWISLRARLIASNRSICSRRKRLSFKVNDSVFLGFVVAHEILIKVKESPLFGKLVDDILKKGVDKIDSLQWKPLEELDGEEIAVEEGIAQANQYCEKIGMKLSTIISVQEVTDFGEEE